MQLETRIELPVAVEYRVRPQSMFMSIFEDPEIEIVSVMFNGHPVELDAEQQDRLERECLEDAGQDDPAPERDEPPAHDVSDRWDGGIHNRPMTEHDCP